VRNLLIDLWQSQDEAQQFMQIREGGHFTFLARLARTLWLLWAVATLSAVLKKSSSTGT